MISLEMYVRIGSECNEVKKIRGKSTLEQISILLLPVPDHITVVHGSHLQNEDVVDTIEVGLQAVTVLDIVVHIHAYIHILNLLSDHLAKANQDGADLTASPVERKFALIS